MEKALPGSDGTRRRRTGRGALPAYVSRDFIITNLVIGLLAGATVGSVGWLLAGYWRPDATYQFGTAGPLQRFSSNGELREFLVSADVLTRGSRSPASLGERVWRIVNFYNGFVKQSKVSGSDDSRPAITPESAIPESTASTDYSTTNIQVEGVDEADIVKTDGEYIYLVSGKKLIIVEAYPPEEAQVVSRIDLGEEAVELLVRGGKLVVFLTDQDKPSTAIAVYNIEDRSAPRMESSIRVDGSYYTSRMIDECVYAVVTEYAEVRDGGVDTPSVRTSEGTTRVEATSVYYTNLLDYGYAFTSILCVNLSDPVEPIDRKTFLLGTTTRLYMSQENMYIATPWQDEESSGYRWGTTVHKIEIADGRISYVADGVVPGNVLNQFSMDEYQGYFRIATDDVWNAETEQAASSGVYVLDQQMAVVGKLEGLAPWENIHSARFMGGMCYLVTFRKVDPLFVINLSDPRNPELLGKLKIPGYSDYLHPYDETHLIGVGKETIPAEGGGFSWFDGVKISLFDVSNVSNPREMAKYVIGDRGSDSPVLEDHKAFLFSRERNLLVLPVLESSIDPEDFADGKPPRWAEGEYIYQGAYVFNISLSAGIQLRGRVTHMDDTTDLDRSGYYFESEYMVERALYIEDVLYTLSSRMVKANDLTDLGEITRLELPGP